MSYMDEAKGKLFSKDKSAIAEYSRSRAVGQLMTHLDMSNYGDFDMVMCHNQIEQLMRDDEKFDTLINAAAAIPPAEDEIHTDKGGHHDYDFVAGREPSLKKIAAEYGTELQQRFKNAKAAYTTSLDGVIIDPTSQDIVNVSGEAVRTELDDIIDGYRTSAKPDNQASDSDENRVIERETPADDWRNASLDEILANASDDSREDDGLGI